MSDPTTQRLDSLERSITLMSDRVGEVAKYMERLVVLEERNVYFREALKEIKDQHKKLEVRIDDLNMKMVRVLTLFSVGSSVLAFGAPYILKALSGGG